MMKRTSIAVLSALAFLAHYEGSAQEIPAVSEQRESIIHEMSRGPKHITGLQLRLQREHSGTISALMSTVDSPAPDWDSKIVKHRAIELLGEYRAAEACGLLLREIEFHPPDILLSHHPLFRYPAAVALTKIGADTIHYILVNQMGGIVSDQRLKIFAYVIWCQYRESEKEVGLFRIKQQLANVRKEQEEYTKQDSRSPYWLERRKNNLERLLKIYQNITPYDRNDWPKPPKSHPEKAFHQEATSPANP